MVPTGTQEDWHGIRMCTWDVAAMCICLCVCVCVCAWLGMMRAWISCHCYQKHRSTLCVLSNRCIGG